MSFFERQTIFLTGCTGHLGACLLYKLVLMLSVQRVYVLVRHSQERATAALLRLMPREFPRVLETGKLLFVVGDLSQGGLGLRLNDLEKLRRNVSIVVHAAANIGLRIPLRQAVCDNCLPSLELARISCTFKKLRTFVHVSSLYALSFLPDGSVEERYYALEDPEFTLRNILSGQDADATEYAWPYARSKHLTENLLRARYPFLPLLIVRPSSIGPAIFEPFELYGKKESIPISQFCERLMLPASTSHVFHAAINSKSGTNILDEIPVDLVANILLQHVAMGTRGPVHANAAFYITRKLDDYLSDVKRWVPEHWQNKMADVEFSEDRNFLEGKLARFYRIATRSWVFLNDRQLRLAQYGPMGISLQGHNDVAFRRRRIECIFSNVYPTLRNMVEEGFSKL